MPAGATVRASVHRLAYSEIPEFSDLFRDYCARFDAVAPYYAGDFHDVGARRAAVERAANHPRDRETLASVLLEQNQRWGADSATIEHISALREPDTAAVVTGQQVGLFAGPAYTILKALSTVQLARQLSKESGRTVVPVFWLGGEDHDFEEVSTVALLRRNETVRLSYELTVDDGNTGPVGRLKLGSQIERLVDELEEILPPTDFREDVMRVVRETYQPDATFSDAFAGVLRRLFKGTGLVLINSDDARLKRLAAPLYRRELEQAEEVAQRIRAVSDRLGEAYHEQVQIRPANLFFLSDAGRFPLDVDGDGFVLRGHGNRFERDELIRLLDEEPARFSPNVVLRPLTQDLLLPTAMYVGGPSEIAYFGQYSQVYEWAGIPMPLIYPRASVTIVESKVAKVLEKYDLRIGDFAEDLDRLFQRVVVEGMDVDLDALFGQAGRHLHVAVNEVKEALQAVDATLAGASEAARQALMEEFDKLKAKAVRLEKKNQEVVRAQIEKAQINLYPGGALQERGLSILYFLNKYGLGLLDELMDVVSTDTSEHQIIEL